MKEALRVAMFLVCALLINTEAYSCRCGGRVSPEVMIERTDIVFVGTVIKGEVGERLSPLDKNDILSYRRFVFEVSEVYRGYIGNEVAVDTGHGGGDCGYNFLVGGEYLVYAHEKEDGRFETGICSGTDPKHKVDPQDVKALRDWKRANIPDGADECTGNEKDAVRTEIGRHYPNIFRTQEEIISLGPSFLEKIQGLLPHSLDLRRITPKIVASWPSVDSRSILLKLLEDENGQVSREAAYYLGKTSSIRPC